jgi:hypothetical protein
MALRQTLITEYFMIIKKRKYSEIKNLCQICKIDMGYQNPRQLCGKYCCRTYPYGIELSWMI